MSILSKLKHLFEKDDPAIKTVEVQGLKINVECEKGQKRDPKASNPITADYGYIVGTKDPVEGDSIDVYVGDSLDSGLVYRVKQLNRDKSFDEFKYMISFKNIRDAAKTYIDSISDNYFYFGGIVGLSWEDFKEYLEKHKGEK